MKAAPEAVEIPTDATQRMEGVLAAAERSRVALGACTPDERALHLGVALVAGIIVGLASGGRPHACNVADAMRTRMIAAPIVTWTDVRAAIALAGPHLGTLAKTHPAIHADMVAQAPPAFGTDPLPDATIPAAIVRDMFVTIPDTAKDN